MRTAAEILNEYTAWINKGYTIIKSEFLNGFDYGQATEVLREAHIKKEITDKEYHAAKELLRATYFGMSYYYMGPDLSPYKNRWTGYNSD